MPYCYYCEDDYSTPTDKLVNIGGPFAHPSCIWMRVDTGLVRADAARELVGPRPATRK